MRSILVGIGENSAVVGKRLPELREIFSCNVLTKKTCLLRLPLAREAHGKVIARVLQKNRADAWNSDIDTDAHQKPRKAWLEFFLFGNCVLHQSQCGLKPTALPNRSFIVGAPETDTASGRVDDVHREVECLVSLGRVGKLLDV